MKEERNAEEDKAPQLSKVFEKQVDITQGESEEEAAAQHTSHTHKPDGEDILMEEDVEPKASYGQLMTSKRTFQLYLPKNHGKASGKMKKRERMRQFQEAMKIDPKEAFGLFSQKIHKRLEKRKQKKQMKNTGISSLGFNATPGQTNDQDADLLRLRRTSKRLDTGLAIERQTCDLGGTTPFCPKCGR